MNHKVKGFGRLFLALAACAAIVFVALCGVGAKKTGSAEGIRLGLDLAGGVSITYETVKKIRQMKR